MYMKDYNGDKPQSSLASPSGKANRLHVIHAPERLYPAKEQAVGVEICHGPYGL